MGPLISFLESIAIAKAFGKLLKSFIFGTNISFNDHPARENGYEVEPSQELVAIGTLLGVSCTCLTVILFILGATTT